jgi:hypothetical protein
LTPSSTALLSAVETVPGTLEGDQMVQGQLAGGAAVVNDQLVVAIVLPTASFAPLTVAVYFFELSSG